MFFFTWETRYRYAVPARTVTKKALGYIQLNIHALYFP